MLIKFFENISTFIGKMLTFFYFASSSSLMVGSAPTGQITPTQKIRRQVTSHTGVMQRSSGPCGTCGASSAGRLAMAAGVQRGE
jgi:Na+/H+-translocating membrane pyrophosphatase